MLRRLKWLVASFVLVVLAVAVWLRFGPIPAGLLDEGTDVSTVVVDRHGVVLYEALSAAGTRRVALSADHLPATLVAATVAAEDRRFRSHAGIDPLAIARAVAHDIARHRLAEGGSTITQQVAKLLLARADGGRPRRRAFAAKVREAILAIRLEHRFSKPQILALYLNLASYGNQVVGAERASQAYFGCSASMLTPAQAAFLAALPQQPSRFNPYRDARAARTRQRAVLRQMRAAGAITEDQARDALAERMALGRPQARFLAPHFVEMVLAASPGTGSRGRIETTLDAGLQADVAGIIAGQRESLVAHGANNVAVVVLDNATGEWLAWEGSGDYYDAQHGGAINGPVTPRQPGSTLKPLTYALAFEQGYSPASVLPDVPTHFPTAEPGVLYSPRNYDGRYRGPLLVRRALAGSENVPAVALASELGVPALLRFLQRAGLSTFDRTAAYYGLGITLGNAEVTLADLTAAYAALARGGGWIRPLAVRGAEQAAERERPLVSSRTAFWITDVLSDADAREYIFGRGGALEFPFPVAAKTGTSQAYHDNWTIGYTRAVTVGVWVGNFDRTPLRDSTGVTGAAPIFHAVMLAAERRVAGADSMVADAPVMNVPDGMERVEICALSGMRANASCPTRIHEWLPAGGESLPCSWHHASDEGLLTIWPPEYRQWAAEHGMLQDLSGRRAPRRAASDDRARPERRVARGAAVVITNPPDGATYSIDPTLRAEFQALTLRAVTPRAGDLEWQVDGVAIGTGPSDETRSWPLRVGKHVITARDADGRSARATILVR